MIVERVPVERLQPAAWNPRIIRDPRFENLCRSIEADPEFLERRPILANAAGVVYGGNMRLRAVQHLGWETVPAILDDIPDQLAKERALKDNRGWGDDVEDELGNLLAELQAGATDLSLLGFEDGELERLLGLVGADAGGEVGEDPGPQLDRAAELQEKWGTARGNLWLIGRHRLLCGDATSAEDVARLMGGERAQLLVTSPPYNQRIDSFHPSGMHREGDWVAKVERLAYPDSLPEPEYQSQQRDALTVWYAVLTDGASAFYNHKNRYRDKAVISPLAWLPGPFHLRQEIIWSRPGSVTQNARMFLPSDERVFWMYKGGDFYFDDSTEIKSYSTVWDIGLETNKDHAVAFPVELPSRCIRACSRSGDVVLDPYVGSGTTMVAAEQLGRSCYASEVDPAVLAVALERLAQMGLEPRRG